LSDARTGLFAALGAVLGGAAGAAAGYAAAKYRPRLSYSVRARGAQEIEDAMVIGGAAGAVVGAFVGGTIASKDPTPVLPR
jgi:hypothetical protein